MEVWWDEHEPPRKSRVWVGVVAAGVVLLAAAVVLVVLL